MKCYMLHIKLITFTNMRYIRIITNVQFRIIMSFYERINLNISKIHKI